MQTYGIMLFYSTREAMEAEKILKEAQQSVRIIPTPETIHASCGFSLKYQLEDESQIVSLVDSHQIVREGIYTAQREGLKTTYQIREEP